MTTAEDVLLEVRLALADCFGNGWESDSEAMALAHACEDELKSRLPRIVKEEMLGCIAAKKKARNGDGW